LCGKSVVFFVAPILSHAYCVMGLARNFQRCGCVVEYWSEPGLEQEILRQGFKFRRTSGISKMETDEFQLTALAGSLCRQPRSVVDQFQSSIRRRKEMRGSLNQFEAFLAQALRQSDPAIVIFDPFRLGYYPFLLRAGVKCVVFSSKPLLTWDPLVPPHTSSVRPRQTRAGRTMVMVSWA